MQQAGKGRSRDGKEEDCVKVEGIQRGREGRKGIGYMV